MKPDGTYTVEELLSICYNQLQSWEREELAQKLGTDFINSAIRDMSADQLEDITGYYVYEEEPQFDIDEELSTSELVDELEDRLSWQSIFESEKKRLVKILETVKTI